MLLSVGLKAASSQCMFTEEIFHTIPMDLLVEKAKQVKKLPVEVVRGS